LGGVSKLYSVTPKDEGIKALAVNGTVMSVVAEQGYVTIDRTWKAGDRIEFEIPLVVQRVKANPHVEADRGRIALRYGPLIYCIESVDQDVESVLDDKSPLSVARRPDLLGGVTVIEGSFTNGKKLTAIPYYLRNNRGGRSIVWVKAK
jgi:DUF1680 family protein